MPRITVGGSGSGAPGPPGPAGAGATFNAVAGQALSADKAVYMAADGKVYLASALTVPQGTLVGFTQTSALINASVVVVSMGEVGIGGGLTAGAEHFLGVAGGVVATPVAPGIAHSVGVAKSATTLVVNIGTSIELV